MVVTCDQEIKNGKGEVLDQEKNIEVNALTNIFGPIVGVDYATDTLFRRLFFLLDNLVDTFAQYKCNFFAR